LGDGEVGVEGGGGDGVVFGEIDASVFCEGVIRDVDEGDTADDEFGAIGRDVDEVFEFEGVADGALFYKGGVDAIVGEFGEAGGGEF
jgi:hypothetical protein